MKLEKIGLSEQLAFSSTAISGIRSITLSAPIAVQYEVTGGCNQQCVFCYNVWKIHRSNRIVTLSSEKRLVVIDRIISMGVFEVILSGGEPLLIPEICKMVYRLKSANITTYIVTNGLLLTESLASRLKDVGLDGIQISLHGSKPSINDAITQKPGSFVRSVDGIKNCLNVFTPGPVSVNMVITNKNWRDVKSMLSFLKRLGVECCSIGFLSKTGLALAEGIGVTKIQLLNACSAAIKESQRLGLKIGIAGGFPVCLFPKKKQKEIMGLSSNICDAGLNQLAISPAGEIRPCVCLPHVVGNILEDDPLKIWNKSHLLRSLRALRHVPSECYDCKWVFLCKGGCRAAAFNTYGNFQKIDPVIV